MVEISKKQMEQWMEKYEVYVDKIINHTYYYLKPEKKEEFKQAGRIGLWKGIQRYYARKPDTFNQKIFIDTICAYIRYEMKRLFADSGLIHLNAKQYRNFKSVEKLKNCSFDVSEECLKKLAAENGYRYDWYLKAQQMMKTVSLDQPMSDEDGGDLYQSVVYDESGFKTLIDQNYLAWIMESALAGIKSDRDKALIRSWLSGIYCGREQNQQELARQFGLSACMVGVILNRFVEICRFVKNCEKEFQNNPSGCLIFPKRKEMTYKGKKVPGVQWGFRNKKWRVVISAGGKNSIFIGYFDHYLEAVRARRDAEILYRGKSDIEI